MENKAFYIKYLDYQPVGLKTHILNTITFEWIQIITTVGDLIAAYQARPGSLLANTDSSLITLHFISNGEETTYNSWDPLSQLGDNGTTGPNPLIIKSSNDSATFGSSDSLINRMVIQTDSIDINTEYLKRPELLGRLIELMKENRVVRLTSPAASGKSSLLKMYQHSLKNTHVVWISFLTEKSAFDLLIANGIDLENHQYQSPIGQRRTVMFLDDAQEKYWDIRFWQQLLKVSWNWLPSNIQVVISSTHLLSVSTSSPASFEYLPKLERGDFLLTPNESKQFLELPVIGLPQKIKSENLKQLVISHCGGLIGALRLSIDSLKDRFAKDIKPTEEALLEHFLSATLLINMSRCFGNSHSCPIGNEFKTILKKIMVDEPYVLETEILASLANQQDKDSYVSLKRAGILAKFPDENAGFSSELANSIACSQSAPQSILRLSRNS